MHQLEPGSAIGTSAVRVRQAREHGRIGDASRGARRLLDATRTRIRLSNSPCILPFDPFQLLVTCRKLPVASCCPRGPRRRHLMPTSARCVAATTNPALHAPTARKNVLRCS